jgi:hypothetical protein
MRVSLSMPSTGLAYLPGKAKPITVDSNALPEDEAAKLEQLVADARLFDRPADKSAVKPRGADYQEYTITVDSGDRTCTIRLADPVKDPDLQALLKYLRSKANAPGSAG